MLSHPCRTFEGMEFEDVAHLRRHPAWDLLRADNSPRVLSFLGSVFVAKNAGAIAAGELAELLDDELFRHNGDAAEPSFPRSARQYLDDWTERRWLRKSYQPGMAEPHYEITPAVEKALLWASDLRPRDFVGTASRLNTVIELLRQMVYGAETDPQRRLDHLRRQRDQLDAEIDRVERGELLLLGTADQRDRYDQFSRRHDRADAAVLRPRPLQGRAKRGDRQTKPIGLRGVRDFTVILGVFANEGYGDVVSVAQVFRMRNMHDTQPERFYVVADRELSITKDFADFGDDFSPLRRRLKQSGARVWDSFSDYGKDFRRRVGIESEQAIELFHQTISLKAVDNLNDFVRSHMLEPFDVADRIEKLVKHFDDLSAAHDAVVRARAQLVILDALVAELDTHDEAASAVAELRGLAGAVRYYVAGERERVLRQELKRIEAELGRIETEVESADGELAGLRAKEQELVVQIAGAGGDRLATIEADVTNHAIERDQRRQRLGAFNGLAAEAGLDSVANAAQFHALIDHVDATAAALGERRRELDVRYRDEDRRRDAAEQEAAGLNAELQSLATRRSNLPRASLELRDALCHELRIDPDGLPFAGELIRVRDDAREWEGAAERVLRPFGLSLLVPEHHYPAVAQWINDRHLGTRLVYFRVSAQAAVRQSSHRAESVLRLVDLLEVRPDAALGDWLTTELARRADHICAETVDAFRAANKAVTRQGQTKDRQRHEKDDRRRIDDRREYILGWDNEAKTNALIAHAAYLQTSLNDIKKSLGALDDKLRELDARHAALNKVSVYEWPQLDWEGAARRVADLEDEAVRIRGSSSELGALAAEKDLVSGELAGARRRHEGLLRRQGDLSGRVAS